VACSRRQISIKMMSLRLKAVILLIGKSLRERIAPSLGPVGIQIADNLFIAPVSEQERESSMLYLNHSCDHDPEFAARSGSWPCMTYMPAKSLRTNGR
jgi:hypothetical protein